MACLKGLMGQNGSKQAQQGLNSLVSIPSGLGLFLEKSDSDRFLGTLRRQGLCSHITGVRGGGGPSVSIRNPLHASIPPDN